VLKPLDNVKRILFVAWLHDFNNSRSSADSL